MSDLREEAKPVAGGGHTEAGSRAGAAGTTGPKQFAEQGTRSERRVKRTAVRKRQQRNRLIGGAGLLLLVVLVAVVAPILLGDDAGADEASTPQASTTSFVDQAIAGSPVDPEGAESTLPGPEKAAQDLASGPSTTYFGAVDASQEAAATLEPPITSPVRLPSGSSSPGAAVFVTEAGALSAVVVLQPVEQRGVSVGMPAATLVRTAQGYDTIESLYESADTESLMAGLGTILGLPPIAGGSTEVSALEGVLSAANDVDSLGAGGQSGVHAARRYAEAVLALAGVAADQNERWTDVVEGGNVSAVLQLLGESGTGEAIEDWQAAILPGRLVSASEAPYFDTDMSAARQLSSHPLALGGADVVLSVLNGSGAVGAAEAVAASLVLMDCAMLPFANAPGFPDVEKTLISAGPGATAAAQQINALLGAGAVTEDDSLAPGHVVVVVGKDLDEMSAVVSAVQPTSQSSRISAATGDRHG